jgi:hypothetical protein
MRNRSEEQLTLFAADSPASPPVRPGSDEARQMTAGSGRICFESWAKSSPGGACLKTCVGWLLSSTAWSSTAVWLTWKASATKSKRLIFRLAESEPPIDVTGFGLLPTPAAQEHGYNQGGASPDGQIRYSIEGMARRNLIPTPQATDSAGSGSRNTPDSKAHFGVSLTDWARGDEGTGRLMPTPDANCWKGGAPNQHKSQLNGRLNPEFVEAMMGFPNKWTEI